MNLTNQIMAEKEDMVDFIKNYPSNTPVVMVNILKFKDQVAEGDKTGRESYNEYGKATAPLLEKVGGKVLWVGKVNQTLIGDSSGEPNRIMLVQYPNKEALISMITSEEYAKISHLREGALEYGGLIATETIFHG